jgi:hypothetical protein
MPTPRADTYAVASGADLWAGRDAPFADIAPLLNLIAAAPSDSFVKLNTNTFEDSWPPADSFRNSFGSPARTLGAWSSVAWDFTRHQAYLFGGGHANSDDCTVYLWDGKTREWRIGYYSQRVVLDADNGYMVVGGPLNGMISCHTYDNNLYLPTLDRFYCPGGAAHSSGGQPTWFNGTVNVPLGGYLCKLDLIGQGMVGGLDGSNWIRSGDPRELDGADPWEVLNYRTIDPAWPLYGHISGASRTRVEGGNDVVIMVAPFNTVKQLRKIVMPSADPATHTYSQIGRTQSQALGLDISLALETSRDVAFIGGRQGVRFWDLKTQGPTNEIKTPTFTAGADLDDFLANGTVDLANRCLGLDAHPDGGIYVWNQGGKVWRIDAPAGNPTPTTGWTVTTVCDQSTGRPLTSAEMEAGRYAASPSGGVLGKFRWADDLGVFIAIQDNFKGDVFAYRPAGWTDPRN